MSARDAETPAVRCTGEPLSWLALERLRLGELAPAERSAVEQHLAACAACAACLAEIDRPLSLPALPASPVPAPLWSRLRAWWRTGNVRVWAPAGVAALLALFLIARPQRVDDAPVDHTLAGIKGGGVALSLVRERDGAIEHGATTFAGGDHWKVLVTCPTARVIFWDLVVLDGATATFPLAPAAPIGCGNRVPLPGAFRLDGDQPLEVCVLLAGDPIDRSRVTAHDERATCVLVRPER